MGILYIPTKQRVYIRRKTIIILRKESYEGNDAHVSFLLYKAKQLMKTRTTRPSRPVQTLADAGGGSANRIGAAHEGSCEEPQEGYPPRPFNPAAPGPSHFTVCIGH